MAKSSPRSAPAVSPAVDVPSVYRRIGAQIKRKRDELNLTQEGLAELVGLSRTSVTNIEKGRQKFLVHTLVSIAQALRMEASALLALALPAAEGTRLGSLLNGRPSDERKFVGAAAQRAGMGVSAHGSS